MASFSGQPG